MSAPNIGETWDDNNDDTDDFFTVLGVLEDGQVIHIQWMAATTDHKEYELVDVARFSNGDYRLIKPAPSA